MTHLPEVVLGEQFTSIHERFEVNTPAIAQVLGNIGLQASEIVNFQLQFEDSFVISWVERFRRGGGAVAYPGRGWTTRGENGTHITGLNDWGAPMHASPEDYGRTILHELGHVDHMRKRRSMRESKEERLAERFMRRNASVMADLVDYELNVDAVEDIVSRVNPNRIRAKAEIDAKHQKEALKFIARAQR